MVDLKKNSLRLLSAVFFLLMPIYTKAQISVPDYSFTGKEITGFNVKPGYTAIDFKFQPPSKMDVYLQMRKSEFKVSDKTDYFSEEPGFMYGNKAGTSISSLFVGEVAYRNNIVKLFLNKAYIDVINAFATYSEKLKETEYYDETLLLDGVSLYETGNQKEAFNILSELSKKENEYAKLAQDFLFMKASELKRFNVLEGLVPSIIQFSPYSLSIWLQYVYSKDRYNDIIVLLDKYDLEKKYPDFRKLRLSSYYFLKRYNDVVKLGEEIASVDILPLVADAYIMLNIPVKADNTIKNIPDSEIKTIMKAKSDIAKNNFKRAAQELADIDSEKEKLSVFFYTVATKFKDIPADFLDNFFFKENFNNDYVNFYIGLKYLSEKRYADSVNRMALIAFNKDLLVTSYFYQGMASIYTDPSRAEWNFMRYIGAGSDNEKLMLSKFMLSQLYFRKLRYDDALMLVDDCPENYCSRLKADIYLALKQYDKSLQFSEGLKDDRTYLIRASDYYNVSDYKSALTELKKIKDKSQDSEFLLMMCYFKLKDFHEAGKLFRKYQNDTRVFSSGIEQMILAGLGKEALLYLDKAQNLTPEQKVERAKLLVIFNRKDEAKKIFKSFVDEGNTRAFYPSALGLYQIAQIEKNDKEFLIDFATTLEKSKDFDNKDELISMLAKSALELKEFNTAIRYVNYFMDKFQNSPFLPDVYKTRAGLYMLTGRYENCVSDSDKIIAGGKEGVSDALYMKAECMEYINKDKALDIYKSMTKEDDRFFTLANNKITILSGEPAEVIEASLRMKNVSDEIYTSGIVRFFDISDNVSLLKYKTIIDNLEKSGNPKIRSAAYARIGKRFLEEGNNEEAARIFLKGYYLFPNENHAKANLDGAGKSYKARGMKAELAKIEKLISVKNNDKVKSDNETNAPSPKKHNTSEVKKEQNNAKNVKQQVTVSKTKDTKTSATKADTKSKSNNRTVAKQQSDKNKSTTKKVDTKKAPSKAEKGKNTKS